jgi:hypothetical protein
MMKLEILGPAAALASPASRYIHGRNCIVRILVISKKSRISAIGCAIALESGMIFLQNELL